MLVHMTCQIARRTGRAAITYAFLIVLPSALAAQTLCVRCTGPDQRYRCEATADHPIPAKDAGFFCASRIAGDHGHESCAIQRNAADCDGISVSFAYEEGAGLGLPPLADAQPGINDNGEPATLGAFTKDAVSASAETVKKTGENIGEAANNAGKATTDAIKGAGSAIGNATKKTWNCLGSALNDC